MSVITQRPFTNSRKSREIRVIMCRRFPNETHGTNNTIEKCLWSWEAEDSIRIHAPRVIVKMDKRATFKKHQCQHKYIFLVTKFISFPASCYWMTHKQKKRTENSCFLNNNKPGDQLKQLFFAFITSFCWFTNVLKRNFLFVFCWFM